MSTKYGAVDGDDVVKSRSVEMPLDDAAPTFRDPFFAVLFLAHLAYIIYLAVKRGTFGTIEEVYDDNVDTVGALIEGVIVQVALPSVAVSFALAKLMLAFVLPPTIEIAVKTCVLGSLFITVGLSIALCIEYQTTWMYISTGIATVLIIWYVCAVWRFIPFASANLKIALKGMTDNGGTYVIALLFSILAGGWVVLWYYVYNGIVQDHREILLDKGCDQPGAAQDETLDCTYDRDEQVAYFFIIFGLLISFYWTLVSILNTTRVTVAGVMATWCFDKDDAATWCSPAVTSSLCRATTYSFGSICLGSLLQAIITTVRKMMEKLQEIADSDGNKCDADSIIMCLCMCACRCCEHILEYFNQWAYVYVGIYGHGYIESGKRVIELFKERGWTAVISNDLVSYVLNFTAIFVAIVTGAIAIAFDNDKLGMEGHWDAFGVGFITGLIVSSIMMNVAKSAVNTVIVCYAEEPGKLADQHPLLVKEMAEAWLLAFPDCGVEVPTDKISAVVV